MSAFWDYLFLKEKDSFIVSHQQSISSFLLKNILHYFLFVFMYNPDNGTSLTTLEGFENKTAV